MPACPRQTELPNPPSNSIRPTGGLSGALCYGTATVSIWPVAKVLFDASRYFT